MFSMSFMPRFSETDILGHISNTTYPVWLEEARSDLFDLVHPARTVHNWPLIIARQELDFVNQCYLFKEVTVNTWVEKIGTKSFTLGQEILQGDLTVVRSKGVLVWFDYASNSAQPIPDAIREGLTTVMVPQIA